MHLMLVIVLRNTHINDDGGKKYSCKSIIDDDGLVEEEFHLSTKFTRELGPGLVSSLSAGPLISVVSTHRPCT